MYLDTAYSFYISSKSSVNCLRQKHSQTFTHSFVISMLLCLLQSQSYTDWEYFYKGNRECFLAGTRASSTMFVEYITFDQPSSQQYVLCLFASSSRNIDCRLKKENEGKVRGRNVRKEEVTHRSNHASCTDKRRPCSALQVDNQCLRGQ